MLYAFDPRRAAPASGDAGIYRTKIRQLANVLQEPERRSEATEAPRGLVDAIVLTPNASGDALQIELRRNLAARCPGRP